MRRGPRAYPPDVAASVHNLAVDLAEAGRRVEGRAAAQEAVDLYPELARAVQVYDPAAKRATDLAAAFADEA